MKRLLIVVVLAMVVLAVAAAPALAYVDAQAGGPVGAPARRRRRPPPRRAATAAPDRPCRHVPPHGRHIGMVPASTGGNALSIALLAALVIGRSAAASRRSASGAPAKSAKPARLPAFKPAAHQERKAA